MTSVRRAFAAMTEYPPLYMQVPTEEVLKSRHVGVAAGQSEF
jgi:hypothetical protein